MLNLRSGDDAKGETPTDGAPPADGPQAKAPEITKSSRRADRADEIAEIGLLTMKALLAGKLPLKVAREVTEAGNMSLRGTMVAAEYGATGVPLEGLPGEKREGARET